MIYGLAMVRGCIEEKYSHSLEQRPGCISSSAHYVVLTSQYVLYFRQQCCLDPSAAGNEACSHESNANCQGRSRLDQANSVIQIVWSNDGHVMDYFKLEAIASSNVSLDIPFKAQSVSLTSVKAEPSPRLLDFVVLASYAWQKQLSLDLDCDWPGLRRVGFSRSSRQEQQHRLMVD